MVWFGLREEAGGKVRGGGVFVLWGGRARNGMECWGVSVFVMCVMWIGVGGDHVFLCVCGVVRFLSNQMDPFLKGKWHSSKKSVQEEAETVKDIDREQRLFKNTKPKNNSLAFQHQSCNEVLCLLSLLDLVPGSTGQSLWRI